jgi:hypothetical protein
MANRVGPVFSEKTKNASTHHEIEYAVLIKSKKIFVHSQPPRARANHQHAMAENFSMQHCRFAVSGSFSRVYRRISRIWRISGKNFKASAMHLATKNYQSYSTHAARTHASAAAGVSWYA